MGQAKLRPVTKAYSIAGIVKDCQMSMLIYYLDIFCIELLYLNTYIIYYGFKALLNDFAV